MTNWEMSFLIASLLEGWTGYAWCGRYSLIAVGQRMWESSGVCRNCCRAGCSSWKQKTHCSRTVLLAEKNDLAGLFYSIKPTSQGVALLCLCTIGLNFHWIYWLENKQNVICKRKPSRNDRWGWGLSSKGIHLEDSNTGKQNKKTLKKRVSFRHSEFG